MTAINPACLEHQTQSVAPPVAQYRPILGVRDTPPPLETADRRIRRVSRG